MAFASHGFVRRILYLLVALGLAFGAYTAVRSLLVRGTTTRAGDPARVDDRPVPGVVLICLDTLRADALALDSGRPIRMPRLEAFARESVAFADAVAPAAWTGPSMTSLLTGLDPMHTGVVGLAEHTRNLPDSIPTLAERMAGAGYQTAAFTTGAWLVAGTSALRGTHLAGAGFDGDPAAMLRRWNAARKARTPFLLFLHSLAAHDPYLDKDTDPPGSAGVFDEVRGLKFAAALASGDVSDADMRWGAQVLLRSGASRESLRIILGNQRFGALFGRLNRWLDDGAERDPELAALGASLRADYEASLASVDRQVGRILDGLEALALPDGTSIVIVADHGESFAEHGTLVHGRRLFDELVRVPLLVRAPRRMGAPRVVRGAAGLVDVVPTILELAGRAVPEGLDGISLLAAASPDGLPDRALHAFEERRRFDGGDERVEVLHSIRTPRAKCVIRRDPLTLRIVDATVYDLLLDPHEVHPIPFATLGHPCAFGDAFARAARELGLSVPCLAASPPSPGDGGG